MGFILGVPDFWKLPLLKKRHPCRCCGACTSSLKPCFLRNTRSSSQQSCECKLEGSKTDERAALSRAEQRSHSLEQEATKPQRPPSKRTWTVVIPHFLSSLTTSCWRFFFFRSLLRLLPVDLARLQNDCFSRRIKGRLVQLYGRSLTLSLGSQTHTVPCPDAFLALCLFESRETLRDSWTSMSARQCPLGGDATATYMDTH